MNTKVKTLFVQNHELRKWKQKKSGESKSEYQYLQDWNNEKATKHERYYNTLFNGQAVLRQSSDSPQILKVCNNCHLLSSLWD